MTSCPVTSNCIDLAPLASRLDSLPIYQRPTPDELACIWRVAVELLHDAIADGVPEKSAKAEIASRLVSHPIGFSKSESALIRNLERKYNRWAERGHLADQRRQANKSKRAPKLSQSDKDTLIAAAVFQHGGRVDSAWVECLSNKKLSLEICERYSLPDQRRPQCPRSIRSQIQHDVRLVIPQYRSPRHAKLNAAFRKRDWDAVSAGDWYSSDDITLPVYYYLPDGNGWYQLTRGQFLPLIDVKSKRIFDFVLIDGKAYNAFAIRSLITRVCKQYGMPRDGFHFECGIWKKSKLLGGASRISNTEIEENFAQRCSIRIMHSIPGNARAKVVENVSGLLQNLMEGEPGYVGRDEINEKFERVQAAKLEVESRRKTPWEAGFMSAEQWISRLEEICCQYNSKPQNSEVIGSSWMSPDEAWEKRQRINTSGQVVPLVKLPIEMQYLLTSHCETRLVTRNGITFTIGKETYNYKDEQTGALQGQHVITWFDPSSPSELCITDMKKENPMVIPRSISIPAYDATSEQMEAASKSVSDHTKYPRARYSELKPKYMPPARAVTVDAATLERARQMDEQKAKSSIRNRHQFGGREIQPAMIGQLDPIVAKFMRGDT
ncbi:MAG: hypothetical protein WCO56_28155 [Verrucomicrobiota bacterium]